MIRLLTVVIFLGTPLGTVLAWMAAGPVAGIAVLLLLPVVSVLAAALHLRRSADPHAALSQQRERLRSELK